MFRTRPLPTLETSAQAQIDDLVQRNHALTDQLHSEQRRAKDAVAQIQKQLLREQREWREGCDVLVSCHRLAHLRTVADLEAVKKKVIQEEEATRLEKAQRLQRDVRILMFQIREGELEDRIADLEDEKEHIVARSDELMANVRRKLSTLRKDKMARISALEKVIEQSQDKLSQLLQEYAALKASAESNAIKLEQTILRLEGAQAKNTELERTYDELKRSNTELQRQLEKWKNLEIKGTGEMEVLGKQKMELEAKVSNLQDRLQKQVTEKDKELERLNKREEKMKDIVQQWKDEAEVNRSQKEKTDEALAEAQKHIRQLEIELKTVSSNPREPSRERSRSPSQSRKANRNSADSTASSSRKVNQKKPKSKLSPVSEVRENSDVPPRKAKSERERPRKAPSDKGKGKAVPEQPETEDDQDQDDQRSAPKGKRRRKGSLDDDDDDIEALGNKPGPAKKAKGSAKSGVPDGPAKGHGTTQRQNGTRNNPEDGDSGTEQAPVKKKRKINIFANPAEPTFTFMGNDVDLGLNIPTTLSPVKEAAGVPNRSTSASVMSRVTSRTLFKRL